MFEQLDVALAFASIMLLLSLLITAVVQLLVSVFGIRGRHLGWAVSQLLQHCDPDLSRKDAAHLRDVVFRDPLLSTTTNRLLWLVDLVLVRFRRDPTKPSYNYGRRPPVRLEKEALEHAIRRIRDANWEQQPGDLSDNARLQSLVDRLLESPPTEPKESADDDGPSPDTTDPPGQSDGDREASATTAAGASSSRLATGLANWFDVAMTASGERFKLRARWLTAAGALAVGVGLQVDATKVWNQLSTDAGFRDAALANVEALDSIYGVMADTSVTDSTATPTETGPAAAGTDELRQQIDRLRRMGDDLETAGALRFSVPESLPDAWESIGGKLATVLLLSLGAPFWYAVLSGLVGLRGPKSGTGPDKSGASQPSEP